jgi:hypothetical protein
MDDYVNITDELVPFALGQMKLEDACANAYRLFINTIETNTYTCSICNKVIYPKTIVNEHGIFIENDYNEIRGKGDSILKRNVCSECLKKQDNKNNNFTSR